MFHKKGIFRPFFCSITYPLGERQTRLRLVDQHFDSGKAKASVENIYVNRQIKCRRLDMQIGDVVKLKSGSAEMTVETLWDSQKKEWRCVWWVKKEEKFEARVFSEGALEPA